MGSKAITKAKECEATGCAGRHYAKGYCKKHYTQVSKHGELTPDRERGAPRECQAPGCGRTDTIRWYCRKHARQMRVYKRLTPEREHVMGRTSCKVPGCPDAHRANGYCARHYNQERWKRVRQGGSAKAKSAKKAKKVTAKK